MQYKGEVYTVQVARSELQLTFTLNLKDFIVFCYDLKELQEI